ncbi:MAG: hydroxymethylbilane synthase [Dehalococcoidia bacterium]
MSTRTFVVGTRGSRLALRQTEIVLGLLRQQSPDAAFEIRTIKTEGDTSSAPLSEIGGRGVFVIEIERALLSAEFDIAVHSLKDLPADETAGLVIVATPAREDVRDALICRDGAILTDLPAGATIGTGSARRATQLLALRPDLDIRDIRGNVDTRIRKVDEGEYDAAVLAVAGLNRLGLTDRATQIFDSTDFLPAVGQGALAIQVRTDDHDAVRLASPIDDAATRCAVIAERAFERRLGAGCTAAIAALGTLERRGALRLRGLVGQPGGRIVRSEMESPPAEAEMLGVRLAEFLIAQGAEELLEASR